MISHSIPKVNSIKSCEQITKAITNLHVACAHLINFLQDAELGLLKKLEGSFTPENIHNSHIYIYSYLFPLFTYIALTFKSFCPCWYCNETQMKNNVSAPHNPTFLPAAVERGLSVFPKR